MNDSVNTEPAVTDAQIAASRKKMLLIFGCFGIPLVLATLWLQVVRSQGGTWGNTSRGELIHPAVPMSDFSIDQFVMKNEGAQVDDAFREVAEPFTAEDFRKTWSMFYLPEGACEDSCRKNLYHMRQIRLALNNRMNRVQRVVLIESPTQLDDQLLAQHLGLHVLGGDAAAVNALRQQIRSAEEGMEPSADAIYLIDPLGNIMMRFPSDLEPGKVLKDLKHLLKVSRIG